MKKVICTRSNNKDFRFNQIYDVHKVSFDGGYVIDNDGDMRSLNNIMNDDRYDFEEWKEVEEEFVLPDKWYCPYSNKEEFDIMNEFYKGDWLYSDPDGYSGCSPSESNNWFNVYDDDNEYTKITFDQFKKYVMKEEEKESEDFQTIICTSKEQIDAVVRQLNLLGWGAKYKSYEFTAEDPSFMDGKFYIQFKDKWVCGNMMTFSGFKNQIFYGEWIKENEESENFEKGKWYYGLGTNGKWIVKLKEIINGEWWSDVAIDTFDGCVTNDNGYLDRLPEHDIKEVSLEEVQKYLPEGHPDKMASSEKYAPGTYIVWCEDGNYIDAPIGGIDKVIRGLDILGCILLKKYKGFSIDRIKRGEAKWFPTLKEAEEFSREIKGEKISAVKGYKVEKGGLKEDDVMAVVRVNGKEIGEVGDVGLNDRIDAFTHGNMSELRRKLVEKEFDNAFKKAQDKMFEYPEQKLTIMGTPYGVGHPEWLLKSSNASFNDAFTYGSTSIFEQNMTKTLGIPNDYFGHSPLSERIDLSHNQFNGIFGITPEQEKGNRYIGGVDFCGNNQSYGVFNKIIVDEDWNMLIPDEDGLFNPPINKPENKEIKMEVLERPKLIN